ncbi:MAG: RNA-binding protein [Bacteriovoracaceae bacterium]|nr:RNA-binding protein [Bacteriovoracaceae bacterium]
MLLKSSKAAPTFGGIMGKKLYVGNLPFSVNDSSLRTHFATIGNVDSAKVITDRDTGRSKGFGFVEMSTDDEAQSAISKLDGSAFEGRNMTVNEAKPMEKRDNNRSGGFGGGNGGGGRGRY